MNERKQKEIFAKRLKYLIELNNMTQVEVAKGIGTSPQTLSSWLREIAIPRFGKIQTIAKFFNVQPSDLLDEEKDKSYYYDEKSKEIAQEIFENKDLRLLFDASRDVSSDDLKLVHDMLLRLKKKEQEE